MKKKAYFATMEELARNGLKAIPPQMISGKHLIYSSPDVYKRQVYPVTLRLKAILRVRQE